MFKGTSPPELKFFSQFGLHFSVTVLVENWLWHCVKSVQIRRFFWFVFSHIRTEYGCPYSVRMRENMDQKNSVFGCFLCSVIVQVFIIWRLKKSRIFMFSSYYRFVYKGDELIKVSEQWNAVFHIIFVFPPHFSLICLILIYSFALRSLFFLQVHCDKVVWRFLFKLRHPSNRVNFFLIDKFYFTQTWMIVSFLFYSNSRLNEIRPDKDSQQYKS